MNSKEYKKLNDQNKSRLNTNERSIKQKEAEKQDKKKELDFLHAEKHNVKEKIEDLKRKRNEISDEVKRLEESLKQHKNDMNRKKADCLYKTKQQYEEMIRMYENEMKLKKTYSRSEESRLLDDIRNLKKGIETLAEVEKIKNICDQLQDSLNTKKRERDQNWAEFNQYKERLNSNNDAISRLKLELTKIDLDLKELAQKKVELKKASEDLARENIVKKQTLKKFVAESIKKQKKIKELDQPDEMELKIDENLRDLDILINYFKKRQQFDNSESPDSSFNLDNNSTSSSYNHYLSLPTSSSSLNSTATKLLKTNHIVSTSSSSSSLVSLPSTTVPLFSQDMENNKSNSIITKGLPRPDCINLNASQGFIRADTSLSTNTPIDGQELQSGHYHMKQKVNDDVFSKSMGTSVQRNRHIKKSKSKASTPAAHCLDVINLLAKIEMIHLSSQPDECLQELKIRKEKLLNDQKIYKESKLARKLLSLTNDSKHQSDEAENMATVGAAETHLASYAATTNAAANKQLQEIQTNFDTKSEISSCLDSNYESDNNVNGFISSAMSFCPEESYKNIGSAHSILPKLSISDLDRQITITKSLALTNSDDSDVTVNETPLISKKKEEHNSSDVFDSIEAVSKDSSGLCKTPTVEASLVAFKFEENQTESEIKPPKTLIRMNSDGYCSSCTPLSASSINNENPNNNPFFQTIINEVTAENSKL